MLGMSFEPLLLRRRDAAIVLGVSERQIRKWETDGLLQPIDLSTSIGKIRAKRFRVEDVRALAKRLLEPQPAETCA